jgi:hypothetical protein
MFVRASTKNREDGVEAPQRAVTNRSLKYLSICTSLFLTIRSK